VFHEISSVTLTEVKRAEVGEEGEFTHGNNQSDWALSQISKSK